MNLYRLSPLSGSTIAIDTQLETVDTRKSEEIVSAISNNGICGKKCSLV